MTQLIRTGRWCIVFALLIGSTGCLNPQLVNAAVGGLYPTAPGDQPFLAVRVINDTSATLDIPIVWDDGSTPTFSYLVQGLTPSGRDTGVVLQWPIVRVGVGDLDNPLLPLVLAFFPDGTTTGVIFGQPALRAGVDYQRGDTIIFHFVADSRSPAFIRVEPGRVDGASQATSTTREDPYQRLAILKTVEGL